MSPNRHKDDQERPRKDREPEDRPTHEGGATDDPEAATPEPTGAAAEPETRRYRDLADLYGPIHAAAEETLTASAAGKKTLKATEEVASQLAEITRRIAHGELSVAEGSRASDGLRRAFRERHGSAWLDARAANERLHPSAEAVARALDADALRDRRVWSAEIRAFEAILLSEKPAPDDVGTVQQGLGDPPPAPPVHSCMQPAYARHETNMTTQLFSFGYSSANPNGMVGASATGAAADGVGGGASSEGLVGGDVDVPAGHQGYEIVADVDFSYSASSWAVFGASGCGSEILIRIDKGDGSPGEEQKTSLFWLVSPVLWGNGAAGTGNRRLVMPFRRATSSAGQVRVMVGGASHAGAWAVAAIADVTMSLTVKNICVNSTD